MTRHLSTISVFVAVLAAVFGTIFSAWPGSHRTALSLLFPAAAGTTSSQTGETQITIANAKESNGVLSGFEKWLKDHGASFRRCKLVTYGDEVDYRAVHSKKRGIRKGEVVLDLPDKLIITHMMAMSSDIGLEVKKALPDLYTQEATHLYLSLYLLEQRSLGKESYWFPYIATLPKAYPTMTVNFSEDEQSLLKESNLYHELYEAPSNLLRDDYNLLCNHMIGFCFDHSFDDYKWARLSVQSRSFSLDIDGVTASALIPYADMFNHGPDHHLYWRYNATTKSAQFCAIRDVEGNVPIFNSYGLLGSRRALEYYGFAIPENPVETALVRLNIPEYLQAERCVKVSGGREALFNRVDYHVVAKADDSEFLNALVMARVCAAQSIQELRELDLFGKIRFLSFWNEWRALEFLEAAIQDALRNFSHDIAADQNLLNDPKLPFNKRNVIIVRLGEKRVLTNLRTVIQDLKLALIIPMGCFSLFVCGVFGYLLLQ